jgi:long-subunit acyl-CoA synthetase (AMP-forming)
MSGILNSFFSPFFSKSKIVLLPKTSSRSILNFWEDCLKYNVNYINLTPSMCVSLHLIFKGNKKNLKKIGYIKNVIVIGSTLSEEVKSKFYKKFKIRLRQCYGITECGGPITVEKKNSKLVNSSGICGSTTRIKIIENIDGLKTINVKNDFSMKGYYSFNKLSYGAFENGYFDTNDVGIFENKNLFVYGRVKEIIKKNSELVFPNLLDNFFLSNNQILETKTIGIYDKNSLEKIVSFISLSNTLIANVSKTCPGTTSSVAGLVVGVTNPSPSTIISSASKPDAEVYAKSPPVKEVS